MAPRYIRPEVNYQEEIPNKPFKESEVPSEEPAGLQSSQGLIGLGDLSIVAGELRVGPPGSNNFGNLDYGVF